MTYKELQKKAKEMGLPFIGVPKAELEESIKKAENPNAADTPKEATVTTPKEPVQNTKVNTAIVYDGGREIRRYTLETHGPKFMDLAQEFIIGRKYTVKLVDVKMMHTCPACGHKWND